MAKMTLPHGHPKSAVEFENYYGPHRPIAILVSEVE
jgi:hypothetical protein